MVGPGRQRVELQIRTEEMNRVGEYGIAAHALYKDGAKISSMPRESGAYTWLRETIDRLNDPNLNPEEFLENTKLELFHDQVFCFTPKGKIIALPRGANAIDFGYAVHTDVGNTCVGAKINGRIMPLMTELANGDEVEIIRSKAQVPPPAWEHIAVTGKARAAIRRATREAVRKQFGGLGRQILVRAFERADRPLSDSLLTQAAPRLGHNSLGDLIAAVGRGELTSEGVLKAVYPDYQDERTTTSPRAAAGEGWFGLEGGRTMKLRVPGDRIVGILTPGEGITVYPIQSRELKEFDDQPERWLDVRWDINPDDPVRFPARIALTSLNEPGSLAQIAQVIADNDGNIDNIKMVRKGADFHEILIDLEVWDLKHLNRITSQLRQKPIISSVDRVNG